MHYLTYIAYGLLYLLTPALVVSVIMFARYLKAYERSAVHKKVNADNTTDEVEIDVTTKDPVLRRKSMIAKTASIIIFITVTILIVICVMLEQ